MSPILPRVLGRAEEHQQGQGLGDVDETVLHAESLRHELAEYELKTYLVTPGRPLGEMLSG